MPSPFTSIDIPRMASRMKFPMAKMRVQGQMRTHEGEAPCNLAFDTVLVAVDSAHRLGCPFALGIFGNTIKWVSHTSIILTEVRD